MLTHSLKTITTRQTHPSEAMSSVEFCVLLGSNAPYGGQSLTDVSAQPIGPTLRSVR